MYLMRAHTCIYIYIYMHMYIYMCLYVYMYHMHIYIQTDECQKEHLSSLEFTKKNLASLFPKKKKPCLGGIPQSIHP